MLDVIDLFADLHREALLSFSVFSFNYIAALQIEFH